MDLFIFSSDQSFLSWLTFFFFFFKEERQTSLDDLEELLMSLVIDLAFLSFSLRYFDLGVQHSLLVWGLAVKLDKQRGDNRQQKVLVTRSCLLECVIKIKQSVNQMKEEWKEREREGKRIKGEGTNRRGWVQRRSRVCRQTGHRRGIACG